MDTLKVKVLKLDESDPESIWINPHAISYYIPHEDTATRIIMSCGATFVVAMKISDFDTLVINSDSAEAELRGIHEKIDQIVEHLLGG